MQNWRLTAAILATALLSAALSASAAFAGTAPSAETEKAGAVGRTGAVLHASVNPHGSQVSECVFEYGTSPSLGTDVACSYSPGKGVTSVPVEATLAGLSETTTYYFRIHARNGSGESTGEEQQFTTDPTAPRSNTEGAKEVGHTRALLDGYVTPNDSEVTECFFEWGTAPNALTEHAACAQQPGAGAEPAFVSAQLEGLGETTSYYFKLVSRNAYGTTIGGREKFTTEPDAPRANTEPAATVTHTTATLRGYVTAHDALVESCYFEWGSTPYEHTTACEGEPGAGEEPVLVTAALSGLSESTTYDYRLIATNVFGEGMGGNGHFTTQPSTANAEIRKAEEVSAHTAVVKGLVNPEGATATECFFEYGTTPAYGQSAPCDTLPSGESNVKVTAQVTGLSPTTTYLFRLVVTNGFGTNYSASEKFTTYAPGLLPTVTKVKPNKGSSAGGTAVTIKGTNLGEAVAVRFGGVEAEGISANGTESVTAIAPPGVGAVDVTVTTENGTSETNAHDRFTYGAPTITGISPDGGPLAGGTEVTVTGTGFEPGAGGTTFVFSKTDATGVDCESQTTCTMISPAYSKAKTIEVRAIVNGKKSGKSSAGDYTYTG